MTVKLWKISENTFFSNFSRILIFKKNLVFRIFFYVDMFQNLEFATKKILKILCKTTFIPLFYFKIDFMSKNMHYKDVIISHRPMGSLKGLLLYVAFQASVFSSYIVKLKFPQFFLLVISIDKFPE